MEKHLPLLLEGLWQRTGITVYPEADKRMSEVGTSLETEITSFLLPSAEARDIICDVTLVLLFNRAC